MAAVSPSCSTAAAGFALLPPPPSPLRPAPIAGFPHRVWRPSITKPRRPSGAPVTLANYHASTTTSASDSPSSHPPSNALFKTSNSSARRAAIAEVEASTDLSSALSRVEDILQIQDYNMLLRYFGESRRWNEVYQLFKWMQNHDQLNFASYSSYFKYVGLSRNPAKVLQVYDNILDKSTRLNVSICNSVLGCMVRNERYESSLELFDQMKQDGLTPDLVTYSTLLTGCRKMKDGYPKAMKFVEEIKTKGLQMDSVIYGTLLAICASNNLSEDAELYLQKMKDEGHHPNLIHYSCLLNVCAIDGNYMKAEMLIKDMKFMGLVPNKIILTTLLKVYARGGLFEKSKELLAEIEALGYAEDEIPYCTLIDNLAKEGHMKEAQKLFEEVKEKGVKSDGYAYSIMISALCRTGLLQEARQLAKEFEAKYAKYDLVMLNTLLRAYCNAGDMESVMQLLRKMDELTVCPDWNTFHILIKYFCKEKLYHLAFKTIEDMHSKAHQLNEELCSSVILQLGEAGFSSEAFSVYNMLRYSKRTLCKSLHEKMLDILVASGLHKDAYVVMKDNIELISVHSLEVFASSFMDSGNINLINDVVKAYHRSGKRINTVVFNKAIARYVKNPDKKELLLHLLEWMARHGYCVDSLSRNLLLKNTRLFGQKQLIAEILSRQQVRKLRSSGLKKQFLK